MSVSESYENSVIVALAVCSQETQNSQQLATEVSGSVPFNLTSDVSVVKN